MHYRLNGPRGAGDLRTWLANTKRISLSEAIEESERRYNLLMHKSRTKRFMFGFEMI
jgi:hypothetical protein